MSKFRQFPEDGSVVPVDDLIKPYAKLIEEITSEDGYMLRVIEEFWVLYCFERGNEPFDPPDRTIPTGGLSLHESAQVRDREGWPSEVEQVLLAVFRCGMEQGVRIACLKNQEIFRNALEARPEEREAVVAEILDRACNQALITTLE